MIRTRALPSSQSSNFVQGNFTRIVYIIVNKTFWNDSTFSDGFASRGSDGIKSILAKINTITICVDEE